MEQRTAEWFQARLGKVTASNVYNVLSKTAKGLPTSKYEDYKTKLMTERLIEEVSQSYTTPAMQWGIEHEENAHVYGYAEVHGNSRIYGKAEVLDEPCIYGHAEVYGDAYICGEPHVFDNAEVYGNAQVYGEGYIYDRARVYGNAQVYGDAHIYGHAKIYGEACVCWDDWIDDDRRISTREKTR
ncbi:YqaJ viral recombinase family protein [Bartonella sp. OT172YNZD]|uniref:YqaJ viral recombinase family protein n=1 Tax=Bartonella sp. OT172YNZD TaxID=3243572 RepID=UPI0035D02A61